MTRTGRILAGCFFAAACCSGVSHAVSSQPADTLGGKIPVDSVTQPKPEAAPGGRRVTPVENTDNKPWQPGLYRFDRHGNPLKEPVAVLLDEDTVKVDRSPTEKLYGGVIVGVNFFDGILQLAGQSYGSYTVEASVDLYNWFFPTLEVGLGVANTTPTNLNYTYKGGPSFFAKIGIDYNFLYRSDPAYTLLAGLRLGFTGFGYDLTDVTIQSPYWQESQTFNLPGQKSTALYGEVLGGMRIRIYKGLHMGWTIRYKALFHASQAANGSPWFIPGFGARNAPFSATFSVAWRF